jgi:hypothetical protein
MVRDRARAKIDTFSFQFADETRNPLAFVHEGLNLVAAQMMGKPRGFIFPEKLWHALPAREFSQPRWLCHDRK